MQKYAITGHTKGIGLCAYKRLSPNIIGFSKSTGYNINLYKDRQRIIEESIDCDIFINNAHSGFGQVLLLNELYEKWKNTNKTIINVGSRITEIKLPENMNYLLSYQKEKMLLKETSFKLKGQCTVNYRWFGYVGTKTILEKYPHLKTKDYITEDQAVDIILS